MTASSYVSSTGLTVIWCTFFGCVAAVGALAVWLHYRGERQ